MENFPSEARQPGARESAGLATNDETRYADGRKVGEVTYRFGARATVTRDMPGWYIADGTQPDLVVAGANYGKPNLAGRFIVGANDDAGGPGTFPFGATGGSSAVVAHSHDFTHEAAHAVTDPNPTVSQQPEFSAPSEHVISQPVFAAPTAHSPHSGTPLEVTAFLGSGVWVNAYTTAALGNAGRVHDNNHIAGGITTAVTLTNNVGGHAPSPLNRSNNVLLAEDDVTLSNNAPHAGGAVGAISGAAPAQLPPYIAVWPLIKIR